MSFQILITIFEYLPFKDIQNASMACKHWFNASRHSALMNKKVFVLKINDYLNLEGSVVEHKINLITPIVTQSSNDFKHMQLVYFMTTNIFFCHQEKSIRHFNQFHREILANFENLNSLDFSVQISTEEMKTDGKFWCQQTNCQNQSLNQLNSLKIFKISLDSPDMYRYMKFFLDVMPELEHIDIRWKFYRNDELEEIHLLLARNILFNYLNEEKNRIKTVCLDVDGETEKLISTIEGSNFKLDLTKKLQNLEVFI